MEIIKKTILQALTTGTTVPCTYRDIETGELVDCTNPCRNLIPDLSATYNIKIGLTGVQKDIGFFDVVSDEDVEPIVDPDIFVDSNDDVFIDSNNDIFIM